MINKSTKKISRKLELEHGIEKMQESESYITKKDHKKGPQKRTTKKDFLYKISCRLINAPKSDIIDHCQIRSLSIEVTLNF